MVAIVLCFRSALKEKGLGQDEPELNRNWTLSVLFCNFILFILGNVGCPFLYLNWLIAVEGVALKRKLVLFQESPVRGEIVSVHGPDGGGRNGRATDPSPPRRGRATCRSGRPDVRGTVFWRRQIPKYTQRKK